MSLSSSNVLDSDKLFERLDKGGMLHAIDSAPYQLTQTYKNLQLQSEPLPSRSFDNLVIAGVGGSAINGDLLKDWLRDSAPFPIEVCRSSDLPRYVGKSSLVVAISYSGNTLETLSAFRLARKRRAAVVAISSGGLLTSLCQKLRVPLMRAPGGLRPRAAMPSTFAALVFALEQLGAIRSGGYRLAKAAVAMIRQKERVGAVIPTSRNSAKQLANALRGKVTFIASLERNASVARRLKAQINENAKMAAYLNLLPELSHNEIESWRFLSQSSAPFAWVVVRDQAGETLEGRMVSALSRVLKDRFDGNLHQIALDVHGRLEWLLATSLFADYLSFYLAMLRRVDPTPNPDIQRFKKLVS